MARMTRRIISDSFQKWNQTCHQSKKQFRSKEQRMSSEEGGCHGAADVQTEIMVEHSQVWLQVESRGSLFLHQEDLWRVRERKEVCEHGERDGAQGIHLQLVHCCGDVKKEAFREHTEEGIKTSYSCNRAQFSQYCRSACRRLSLRVLYSLRQQTVDYSTPFFLTMRD